MTTPTEEALPADAEEIEGEGASEDAAWGDYPIDTLLIRNESRTVHDVLRRIEQGQFVLDPEFQRAFIWPEDKQSKLIESVLMRIPLPVFYLAEDDKGRMVVVDGLQRLSTFERFVQNKLRLKLPAQTELNGKRFEDLTPKLQNRIEDCNLILYVIDAKAPERARLDIFDRVNGGVPLTRQQMRNSLYMGPATRFLREQAESELFVSATGGSLKTSTMRDREFVNRFCAFSLSPLHEYRDMDEFLARTLKVMNSLGSGELQSLAADFQQALRNNIAVFGRHSFRKHKPEQDSRSIINASLWDVMTVGLSRYDTTLVANRAGVLKQAFYALLEDDDFVSAITYGTNDAKQVTRRFEMAQETFEAVFNAHSA